jgi:Cd2+/Zn2+-exporting ATPase
MLLHISSATEIDTPYCGCETGHSCYTSTSKENSSFKASVSTGFFQLKEFNGSFLTAFLLLLGAYINFSDSILWFNGLLEVVFYTVAWLPVGYSVLSHAISKIRSGDVFTEFLLMSMASAGAFYIGEYPEGVAVMLFYTVGELFQGAAVRRARSNIQSLLDIRPDVARVFRDGVYELVHPEIVSPGDKIQLLAGERVPLDGLLLSDSTVMDASALTGESRPIDLSKHELVLSGMINHGAVIEISVTKDFEHSTVSRILTLVQEATTQKAKTELFIRRFARIYTPIVTILATLVVLIPYFFVESYVFNDWLYRGLVFLVISCPCALVISIPLGYFGGIGAASRYGILVKGGNYLDALLKVNTLVFDKTGTLTNGVFQVNQVLHNADCIENWELYSASLEMKSSHPIAKAIAKHAQLDSASAFEVKEILESGGEGITGDVCGKRVMVGNIEWLRSQGHFLAGEQLDEVTKSSMTAVGTVIDGQFCGVMLLGDTIKSAMSSVIGDLRNLGIKRVVMLSGDRNEVVAQVARSTGINEFFGQMLPHEKSEYISRLKSDPNVFVAFVGDGINDAPSLALADVGIAMGALGSDVAVETADVVLQNDHPKSIISAISIARKTRAVVWQNITMAMGVKVLVMVLGTMGIASLWEAVFADVGVALLAILNAVRIR